MIFPHPPNPAASPLTPGWRSELGSLDDLPAVNEDGIRSEEKAQAAPEAASPPASPLRPEDMIPELQDVFPAIQRARRPAHASYAGSWPKHLFDRLGAACLLVLLAPLLLAITSGLAALGGSPVLIHRNRADWSGRTFRVSSFGARDIAPKSTARRKSANTKPRVGNAATGRARAALSLQEYLLRSGLAALPSLLSVIRGDMSLVGPQPISASGARLDRAGSAILSEMASQAGVRPGLTGWGQVKAARGAGAPGNLSQRIAADLHYLENSTPWLDLRILCAAFCAMLAGEGAS